MLSADVEQAGDMALAKEIGDMLHAEYPGHLWAVYISGGMVHIKNLWISDKWGMAIKYANLSQDAGIRKRKVLLFAGELLERAGLPRHKQYDGQLVGGLEGADGWKPKII